MNGQAVQTRQGDILLDPVEQAARGFQRRKAGPLTLGYGEVTGHSHTLEMGAWVVHPDTPEASIKEFAMGTRTLPVFLVADENTRLAHQEHAALGIAKGLYRVVRQREYTPAAPKPVVD